MDNAIYFVTGNENKIKELTSLMSPLQIIPLRIDLVEQQGSSDEIIMHKAKRAALQCQGTVLVEDTALSFDAFQGLPGPYIKYFIQNIGCDGLYKMLSSFSNYCGQAECRFALCQGEDEPTIFTGIVRGTIVAPRGKRQFGWDPIFQPEGERETFAEMTLEKKNQISHRAKAIEQLRDVLIYTR